MKQLTELYQTGKATPDQISQLANMHYRGIDTTPDNAKALELYKIAADKGSTNATYNYGAMCNNGDGGPINAAVAVDYFAAAALKGSWRGIECRNRIYKDSFSILLASRIVNANPWLSKESDNISSDVWAILRNDSGVRERLGNHIAGHDKVIAAQIGDKLNFQDGNSATKARKIIKDLVKEYIKDIKRERVQHSDYVRMK